MKSDGERSGVISNSLQSTRQENSGKATYPPNHVNSPRPRASRDRTAFSQRHIFWCIWCGENTKIGSFCDDSCAKKYSADVAAERVRCGIPQEAKPTPRAKPGPRRTLKDKAIIESAIDLVSRDNTFAEIAQKLDISRSKVAGIIRRHKQSAARGRATAGDGEGALSSPSKQPRGRVKRATRA